MEWNSSKVENLKRGSSGRLRVRAESKPSSETLNQASTADPIYGWDLPFKSLRRTNQQTATDPSSPTEPIGLNQLQQYLHRPLAARPRLQALLSWQPLPAHGVYPRRSKIRPFHHGKSTALSSATPSQDPHQIIPSRRAYCWPPKIINRIRHWRQPSKEGGDCRKIPAQLYDAKRDFRGGASS